MSTVGDAFRIYIKPSLDGRIVARKKTTKHVSERVKASKLRLKAYRGSTNAPAKVAHDNLVKAGKCVTKRVYVPNKGYESKPVCPIKEMREELKTTMTKVHTGA